MANEQLKDFIRISRLLTAVATTCIAMNSLAAVLGLEELGECRWPQLEGVNGEGWKKGELLQEENNNICGKPGMNNLLLNIYSNIYYWIWEHTKSRDDSVFLVLLPKSSIWLKTFCYEEWYKEYSPMFWKSIYIRRQIRWKYKQLWTYLRNSIQP